MLAVDSTTEPPSGNALGHGCPVAYRFNDLEVPAFLRKRQ